MTQTKVAPESNESAYMVARKAILKSLLDEDKRESLSCFESYLVASLFEFLQVTQLEAVMLEIERLNQLPDPDSHRVRKRGFIQLENAYPMKEESPFFVAWQQLPEFIANELKAFASQLLKNNKLVGMQSSN